MSVLESQFAAVNPGSSTVKLLPVLLPTLSGGREPAARGYIFVIVEKTNDFKFGITGIEAKPGFVVDAQLWCGVYVLLICGVAN